MKTLLGLVLLIAAASATECAAATPVTAKLRIAQASPAPFCVQVISCGTKDGKRKEYPTPCAAKDDGATDIKAKSGPSC